MHPRKFVRDSLGFAVAQYVMRGLLIVRGVVGASLLGAHAYGAWNAIQLLMDYGMFAPLGTQQGLDQAVPAAILEDDPARLDRLKRAGLFNIVVLSAGFVLACVAYVASRRSVTLEEWGVGGLTMALACVALTNLSYYHMTLLRSHGNIGAVSRWFVIQGVIGTIVGLALIPLAGMWGLLIGWTLATLAATASVAVQGRGLAPLVPRPGPDAALLVSVGLPLYLFLAFDLVTRTLDRLIILKFLGTEQLGYYSMAVMGLAFLLYLPDSVKFVLYPRLLAEFHAAGNRPEAIRPSVERPLRALALIMPALCGVGYLCARDGVLLLLPAFARGITAVRVLSFGAGPLAFVSLSSIVLMTLRRGRLLVPVAIAVIAVGAALDLFAIWMQSGINGVARATLATYTVNGVVLLWLASAGLGLAVRSRIGILARAFLPLALSFVLAYGLDKLLPWSPDLARVTRVARMAGGVMVFAAVYLGLLSPFFRGLGLRRLLLELELPLPFVARRVR